MCGWFPAASCVRTWGWGETCCSGPLSDRLSPLSPLGQEGLLPGQEEGPALQSLLQALSSPITSPFLSHLPEARISPSALGPLPSCGLSLPHRGCLATLLLPLPCPASPPPGGSSAQLLSWAGFLGSAPWSPRLPVLLYVSPLWIGANPEESLISLPFYRCGDRGFREAKSPA